MTPRRRRKRKPSNSPGPLRGIRQLPGFAESLRLLVEREQYSQTDIALMFGTSRERIRQICNEAGLRYTGPRGLWAVRVWDDEASRFRPVPARMVARKRIDDRISARAAAQAAHRAARQAEIVAIVIALRDSLQRSPTWLEIYVALGGHAHGALTASNASILVLHKWDSRRARTQQFAELRRQFFKATGLTDRLSRGRRR